MNLDLARAAGVARGLPPQLKAVLKHLAEGLSRKEIAGQMGIEFKTADNYVTELYSRLGVHNSREAVKVALWRKG